MNLVFLLLIGIPFFAFGEPVRPESTDASPQVWLISPLAPLSPRIPVEMSDGNRSLIAHQLTQSPQSLFTSRLFPWRGIFAFFALGLALPAGYFYIIRRSTREQKEVLHKMTAAAKAARAMKNAQNSPSASLGDLMSILRSYIEEAYQIRASHMTTEEFLQQMVLHPVFAGEKGQMLAQFLRECDVRFRPQASSREQVSQALQQLQAFLNTISYF